MCRWDMQFQQKEGEGKESDELNAFPCAVHQVPYRPNTF